MTKLSAPFDRFPWTAPILDGLVKPQGYELDAFVPEGGVVGAFRKMMREDAFDGCELGITTYLSAWDYGLRCTAIPAFLAYNFPQRGILYNIASGITEPKDLEGKRIGGRTYTVTGVVWARGLLQDVYGVDIDSITWVVSDKEHVEAFEWPKNVEYLPGADLGKMLEDGELDAGIGIVRTPSENLRPLIEDPDASERDWYKSTGIYPINHVFVIRNEVLKENPDVAKRLYDAFIEAKQIFLDRLDSGVDLSPEEQRYEKSRELLGSDPVPFGIEDNRATLEALVRYSVEQGIIAQPISIEEMFVPGL
jgi:4,5-dihydroxyphthalate decarboxylase